MTGASCSAASGCELVGSQGTLGDCSSLCYDGPSSPLVLNGSGSAIPSPWPIANVQGVSVGSDQWGGCSCASGEPVNDATGDFYDTTTDLSIPFAGIPLKFTRTYDAEKAQAEASTTPTPPAGPLGYGWSDNLGMSLNYHSQSGQSSVTDSNGQVIFNYLGIATINEANGAQITFDAIGAGQTEPSWCPDFSVSNGTSDSTSTIYCPAAPRYLGTLSLSGSTWTYVSDTTAKSPITYTFTGSTTAPLTRIADQSGDALTAGSYTKHTGWVSCPSGDTCTAWSSVPAGDSASTPIDALVEAFNASGQLVKVYGAIKDESAVTFAYSGSGCSTWPTGQVVDICSATDPGSLTTSYTYDSGNSTTSLEYDELSMIPPGTGEVVNTYDGESEG